MFFHSRLRTQRFDNVASEETIDFTYSLEHGREIQCLIIESQVQAEGITGYLVTDNLFVGFRNLSVFIQIRDNNITH